MARIGTEHIGGMLRGAVGSLAGLAAMGLFFRASQALSSESGDSSRADGADGGNGAGPIERHDALDDLSVVGHASREDEPATATIGRMAYAAVRGEEPDEQTKQRLGQAVHWGYGILLGGVYGALRGAEEPPDLLAGLGYGAAAWVLGDELMVPLLGLSEGPTAHDWTVHATGLGAHLVYGAATSAATQALRRVM